MKFHPVWTIAALAAVFAAASPALALHDGGVARCEACHTMHNSLGNAVHDANLTTQFTTGPFLLKGNDPSSACLNCHSGATTSEFIVSTSGITEGGVPRQFTPGGDFAWLKMDSAGGGHNIIAADQSYSADTRSGMANGPGGDYPNASLGCQSCHDPHGKYRVLDGGIISDGRTGSTTAPIASYGSYGALPTATEAVGTYRLLGGIGYLPKSVSGSPALAFVNQTPAAVAPVEYNNMTPGGVRVAYGSGMSEWCANCHGGIHNDDYPSNLRHPSGNNEDLGATVAGNYNAYLKTGDLSGNQATSFLPLVPFETGQNHSQIADLAALVTATTGPDSTANVMCLTCHRAHASAFNSMLRWDHTATFIAEGGAYAGALPAQQLAAYYNKPASDWASYQRSLCNKCHVKD